MIAPSGNIWISKLTLLFVILSFHNAVALTNLFTGNGGNDNWNNTANWSLGVVPNATHDVTVASGELVRIVGGTQAYARSVYLSGDNEMIIAVDAALDLVEYMYIFSGAILTNRGNLTLLSGCEGIKISLGGILENKDTIIIYRPDRGIDFSEGYLLNEELIWIDSALYAGIFMFESANPPNSRHLLNEINATIHITNVSGAGIWLSDTLTNYGDILIENVDRDHPNVPAEGIYVVNWGELYNHGAITIDDSEDNGLNNDYGEVYNEADGVISLTGFQDKGIINNFLMHNYGTLDIQCDLPTTGNRGIHILNSFINKTGGEILIDGNDILEVAIEVDYTFTNEAGASVHIVEHEDTGILVDDGGFTNYGIVDIGDVIDLLGYGMEAQSYVNNYGKMFFEDMGSGIFNNTSYFINYDTLVFRNLLSKAIFSQRKLVNEVDGLILIYNDDGSRISWGITSIDDIAGQEFINRGSIYMDSVNVGLDLRIGDFYNHGLLQINHYRFGIDFGTFYDPAVFTNFGDVIIKNHQEPFAYTIYVEGGDPGTYNFINEDTATLEIMDAHRGIWMRSGMKNDGLIKLTNITENGIYLYNTTTAYQFLNSLTGSVIIENAQHGMYLGTYTSADNLNSFINEGEVTFKQMVDYGITGDNDGGKFENYGAIKGNVELNGDYVVADYDFYPGLSPGIILFDNYQAIAPVFHIEMKGEAGAGQPNGHDVIIVTSSLTLTGELIVTTLGGFAPEVDNEYNILISSGTITGTFSMVDLPSLGPNLAFEVIYESNKVKLKVIPVYNYWDGSANSNWNNTSNWSTTAIPDENTFVRIPSGAPNYPALNNNTMTIGSGSGTFKCKRMIVDAGGQITLINISLDIMNILEIGGVFSFFTSEEEQIALSGNGSVKVLTGGMLDLEQF